jgi:hypothetical protein
MFRGTAWLLWPAALLIFSSAQADEPESLEELLLRKPADNAMACSSVRKIDDYLSSQPLKLEPGQTKPLVELLNALKVYQTLHCEAFGSDAAEGFPLVVQKGLLRVRQDPDIYTYGGEPEKDLPVITKDTVEQVKDVAPAAPPEFQSAVFTCVSDYERCNTYYISRGQEFDAGLGCGMTFMVCIAAKLIHP